MAEHYFLIITQGNHSFVFSANIAGFREDSLQNGHLNRLMAKNYKEPPSEFLYTQNGVKDGNNQFNSFRKIVFVYPEFSKKRSILIGRIRQKVLGKLSMFVYLEFPKTKW